MRSASTSRRPVSPCCLGLNGAGKSTLFSVITHLYASRSGAVRIFGRDVARESGAALALLGVVFQQRTLDPDLSVAQNLAYHGALHGIGPARNARATSRATRPRRSRRPGPRQGALSLRRSDAAGRDRACAAAPAAHAAARRADGGARHQGARRTFSRSCAASSPTKESASFGRPISSTRFATTIMSSFCTRGACSPTVRPVPSSVRRARVRSARPSRA